MQAHQMKLMYSIFITSVYNIYNGFMESYYVFEKNKCLLTLIKV